MHIRQSADIVVGLEFGDEGKGTMTNFLCRLRNANLVVRYNGGSQAGHNVTMDSGIHHTFRQIGSGAFVPGVITLLSEYMMWDPVALAHEVAELSPKIGEHALNRHVIDCRAPVISLYHVASNRMKEWMRGAVRHGSCGKGIGETGYDLMYRPDEVIRAGDLRDARKTKKLLSLIQARKQEELEKLGICFAEVPESLRELAEVLTDPSSPANLADLYHGLASEYTIISAASAQKLVRESVCIFEGAQGILLDEWHGFHPYTTWSTIVPAYALRILEESGFNGEVEVVGVMRSYMTRHGAGPFVTEDANIAGIFLNEDNRLNEWQQEFRIGHLDGIMLRYASDCLRHYCANAVLAITHLDALDRIPALMFCNEYATERGSVKSLAPQFARDLLYQEELTRLLQGCSPVLSGRLRTPRDVIEWAVDTTGFEARYTSFGPKTRDKQVLF